MARRRVAGVLMVAALVAVTAAPTGASTQHTVRPGDSLWAIARAYGVTIEAILAANSIADPDLIVSGSILLVPDRGGSGADSDVHVVARGDTVWAIATKYGIGIGQLARQNGLVGSDPIIHPGQVLTIRPGAGDSSDPASATSSTSAEAPVVVHTVVRGETLSGIARRYGITLSALVAANGIVNPDLVTVDAKLLVPGSKGSNRLPPELLANPGRLALLPLFDRWATEYGVDADLLKALTWFESGWNNSLISSAGAIGIGQVLPITADFVSENLLRERLDPRDPEENIRLSARFLRYLLDHTGDTRLAIAAYYQGLTATRQHGIFRSSQFYVSGILSLRDRFR